MIISKKNNFIFVRILKTGSTSAQAMLTDSGILGLEDIYTGYRNDVNDTPTVSQNVPADIDAAKIREASPYSVPTDIPVQGDGTFPLLGHLAPTEMVRLNLISKAELDTYNVVGVVRDPIDRFLSAGFFGMSLYDQEPTQDKVLDAINYRVTNKELPLPFLGKTQRNFFEYYGKLLPNIQVIDYAHLNSQLDTFIQSHGGSIAQFETLKDQYRPDWAKVPYTDWLPAETIEILQSMMASDIEFYNEHKV